MTEKSNKSSRNLSDLLPKDFVERRAQEYELKELAKKEKTYWDFLGELGFFVGFEAVKAVLDDYIELGQARELLNGARRAYYGTVYDSAVASLAGARGATKGKEFTQLIKFYEREML